MSTAESPQTHDSWQVPPELRLKLLALLACEPTQAAHMTYEEFLEWADEDTLAEWVDGKVIMTSPASRRHQEVVKFLTRVLSSYAEIAQPGTVLVAPFQMKLPRSGREPDIIFLAQEHESRLKTTYLDGPADLVVEIISPESIGRDRGDKFYEYQAASIPEYWLIDPDTQRAEFYQLDARGSYQLVAPGEDGAYHSRILPDFWLRVEWLWQDPLPAVEDALLSIAGARYATYLLDRLRHRGFLASDGGDS